MARKQRAKVARKAAVGRKVDPDTVREDIRKVWPDWEPAAQGASESDPQTSWVDDSKDWEEDLQTAPDLLDEEDGPVKEERARALPRAHTRPAD
jgi:hypothetical protein